MFDEDFYAYGDKDQTSKEFGVYLLVDGIAPAHSEAESEYAHKERQQADDTNRKYQAPEVGITGAGKCNPHCQSIYAGCDSEQYLLLKALRIKRFRIFLLKRLHYQLTSDERKHSEGYPMVVSFDGRLEPACQKPAEYGHESLEETEEERHPEDCSGFVLPHDDSGGDGNRKAVHRKSQSYEYKFDQHPFNPSKGLANLHIFGII